MKNKNEAYEYSLGRISVPKIKYQYYDTPKRKKQTNKFEFHFSNYSIVDGGVSCEVQVNAHLQAPMFSSEIYTQSIMRVRGNGISEEDIETNRAIQAELVLPLLNKVTEIIARLTGDSAPHPLIFTFDPHDLLNRAESAESIEE